MVNCKGLHGTNFGARFCQYPTNVISTSIKISIKNFVASLQKVASARGNGGHIGQSFIQVKPLGVISCCKRMDWSIKSSADGRGLDPLSSSGDGRTRLLKTIQNLQIRLNARIRDFQKDLPKKFLSFLVGFYCATAFATVIGQTGDWDIMSAAVAVAVVEGIGALMYKASVPLLDRSRNLIVLFNYWKAGLTLGLFLDSFKYFMALFFGHLHYGRDQFSEFTAIATSEEFLDSPTIILCLFVKCLFRILNGTVEYQPDQQSYLKCYKDQRPAAFITARSEKMERVKKMNSPKKEKRLLC